MFRLRDWFLSKIFPRKYRNIYSRGTLKSASLVREDHFPSSEVYPGRFLSPKFLNPLLNSCRKSGVWIRQRKAQVTKVKWTSSHVPYFLNLPVESSQDTAIGNFIEKVSLVQFQKITCTPISNPHLNLNKYLMRIQKTFDADITLFDNAFFAICAGGNSFQHFVQDVLPIITFYKPFLDMNQEVKLLLVKPLLSFRSFDEIIRRLNLKNEIILIDENTSFSVNSLFVPIFAPLNALYSTPVALYKSIRQSFDIDKVTRNFHKRLILLVIRKEQTRNFWSDSEISDFLNDWAAHYGLIFETAYPKDDTCEETIKKFQRASIIVAMHGGANYNIIFSETSTVLVEIIPTINCNTLADFALSIGIDYLALPINGSTSDAHLKVPLKILGSVLDELVAEY